MERLTEYVGNSILIKGCKTIFAATKRKKTHMQNAIVKLAAYEDAMSLERAQNLAQAEKDGRLVVLDEPRKPPKEA